MGKTSKGKGRPRPGLTDSELEDMIRESVAAAVEAGAVALGPERMLAMLGAAIVALSERIEVRVLRAPAAEGRK